jgi:hypothetical protein
MTSSFRLGDVRVPPVVWIVLSLVCVALDYLTGPVIQFPFVYLAPISIASWSGGRNWGLVLAVALPLVRLSFRTVWDTPWTFWESTINAAIRITVFVAFAWLVDRVATQMRKLQRMRLLERMLGICSTCGQIHDGVDGSWQSLEEYAAHHREEFEHDLCPTCARRAREAFDRR